MTWPQMSQFKRTTLSDQIFVCLYYFIVLLSFIHLLKDNKHIIVILYKTLPSSINISEVSQILENLCIFTACCYSGILFLGWDDWLVVIYLTISCVHKNVISCISFCMHSFKFLGRCHKLEHNFVTLIRSHASTSCET